MNDEYISTGENENLGTMQAVAAHYPDKVVLDFPAGEVHNAEVTKNFLNKGYCLVGNPFPKAIDWDNHDGWERTNLSSAMWSWVTIGTERVIQTYNHNDDGPRIYTIEPEGYDETNISHIPPYQSVQVKVETDNTDLTIKRSVRVRSSDAPLKSTTSSNESSYGLIRVRSGNAHKVDGAVLYSNENFREAKGREDSEKQFNSSRNVPEVYTKINNQAVSINGLPALAGDSHSVPPLDGRYYGCNSSRFDPERRSYIHSRYSKSPLGGFMGPQGAP